MELESAACCEVHIPEKTGATVVKPAAAAAASGGRGRKRRQHTVVAAAATAAAAEKDSSSSSAANSLDPVDDWEREELFREQWALIEAKLLEETSAFFGRYVRLLVDFIGRHCGHDDGQSEERYHQQVGFNFGMLPVALIALNSKMTQSRVHAEVEEMLTTKDSSSSSNIHRLCLNSFNLASMSALLQALFNGLISDEVCEENDLDGGHWKNMSVDEVIELWFESNSSAKGKDQKSSSSPPPPSLVLFVFDFETVNKQTLLTLILLLKEHTHRAAISMVFFLASSHNARSMQYYLPAQATDHLAFEELEPFYEPALIPRLLEALVVDESLHFRLHPTMLRQLAAHTTNYEFTFANFFLLLKSLVFEHFYADPLSVVCQEPRSLKATLMKELAAAAASSKSRQSLLPLLQNSLPLAAAAESDQADEDSSADTEDGGDNDKAYIGRLTAQLEELHSQHARFTLALQIVIDLLQYAHCLPVKSTQNTTRSSSSTTAAAAAAAAVKISSTAFLDHYCDAVTEPAYNFEEGLLSELLERLSESSAKLALKRLLAKYRDVEEEVEEKEELIALLAEYQTKLAELQRQEAEEEARQQEHSKKLGLEIDMVRSVTVVKEKLRAVQSRTEWRQTLSSSSSAQKKTKAKKNLLPFEQWKTELVGALAEALRAASPATRRRHRLLAEALFARAAVERHFREVHCVCTRDRLARTLSQTGGCGGGGGSSGSKSHSFATCYPNSFILYQLYREAAPVVNLADWYEQFGEEKRRQGQQQQTQQQPGSSKKGGKEAAAAAEGLSADELTVHFSTTLSDFDYIGLLQSSRYKADYLNRLAWF